MSRPTWGYNPQPPKPRQVFKAKPVRSPHVARAIAAGKNMRHGLHGLGFAVNSFVGGMEDVREQSWRQQQVDAAQADKAKAEAKIVAQNNAMRTLAGEEGSGYVDAGLGREYLSARIKAKHAKAKGSDYTIKPDPRTGDLVRVNKLTGEQTPVGGNGSGDGQTKYPAPGRKASPQFPPRAGKKAPPLKSVTIRGEKYSRVRPDGSLIPLDTFGGELQAARNTKEFNILYPKMITAHQKAYDGIQGAAMSASEALGKLDIAEAAIMDSRQTGTFGGTIQDAKKLATLIGITPAGTTAGEVLHSINLELTKMARGNTSTGEGLAGAVSNMEMKIYMAAMPSLGNTKAGNRIILEGLRAMQTRRVEAAEVAERYLADKRQAGLPMILDAGFKKRLNSHFKDKPLFNDRLRGALEAANEGRLDAYLDGTAAPAKKATAAPSPLRKRNPATGEVIEYDGQNWVPFVAQPPSPHAPRPAQQLPAGVNAPPGLEWNGYQWRNSTTGSAQ